MIQLCVVERTHVFIHMDLGLNSSSAPDQVNALGQFASSPWTSAALSENGDNDPWFQGQFGVR